MSFRQYTADDGASTAIPAKSRGKRAVVWPLVASVGDPGFVLLNDAANGVTALFYADDRRYRTHYVLYEHAADRLPQARSCRFYYPFQSCLNRIARPLANHARRKKCAERLRNAQTRDFRR